MNFIKDYEKFSFASGHAIRKFGLKVYYSSTSHWFMQTEHPPCEWWLPTFWYET